MTNIRGVITALVTPFKNQEVDYPSLERLIAAQLKGGVSGFVVHGTTGESPTVTDEERKKIFDFVKSKVPAGFPLIVGTGTNSTANTIENTRVAKSWGATAALVVVPYYNKPPQRGLFEHFSRVAADGGLPVILYNVPSRTVAGLALETVARLSRVPGIIGIKEATGDVEFARQIRAECGPSFILLSGDDGTYEGFLAAGGDGIISVASHVIPVPFVKGRIAEFQPLIQGLYVEANPIPVKKALQLMQIIDTAEMRLPLVAMDEKLVPQLKESLEKAGVLQ